MALLLACGDHVSSLIDCLEFDDRMARLEAARAAGNDLLLQLNCFCAATAVADAAGPGRRSASRPRTSSHRAPHPAAWRATHGMYPSASSREVLQHGMDPLSFIRYLSTLGDVRAVVPLFDSMPDAQAMDPQVCYVGLEIQFSGAVDRQHILDAFEYVRDDSTIRILPPHARGVRIHGADPVAAGRRGEIGPIAGRLRRADPRRAGARHADAANPIRRRRRAGRSARAGPTGTRIAGAAEPGKARKAAGNRYMRVDAGKLDELIDLVGELVIASAGVSLCARRSNDADLREATAAMSRLVEDVRDGALTLRMVPIGETFNRFNRVVHDLGRELGKDVELEISGAETELDKSMVEKLSDPLMHLVRNALDHGIECPSERLLRGKPAARQVAAQCLSRDRQHRDRGARRWRRARSRDRFSSARCRPGWCRPDDKPARP